MGLSTSTKTFAERLEESKKDKFAKCQHFFVYFIKDTT